MSIIDPATKTPNLMPAPIPPADAAPGQAGRVKLAFLDGLRGLAALYVLLYHLTDTRHLPPAVAHGLSFLRFGHYAVAVFIVLSGYCLMLPVARSVDGRLRGGAWNYLKRRAIRILPPYYAALAFSLALVVLSHRATHSLGIVTDDSAYRLAMTPGSILSHLLLLHNWNKAWIETIDGPMWSVAIEWQIYFLFPLLLLPLWRRFGSLAAVAVGLLIGILPFVLLPPGRNFDWSCPWYTGLFAMGMAGASVGFSRDPRLVRLNARLPWGGLAVTALGLFLFLSLFVAKGTYRLGILALPQHWWVDALVGAGTACTLVFCARSAHEVASGSDARPPLILRIFESRFAIWVGSFSYSLYLVHLPLIVKMESLVRRHFSPTKGFVVMLLIGIPISLAASYLFHLIFERPFMPEQRSKREVRKLAPVAAPSN